MQFACDADWWIAHPEALDLTSIKIAGERRAGNLSDNLHIVTPQMGRNEMIMQAGRIGWGGNSGFQAVNLAMQFGARKIILIGYDMAGEHWHGRHQGRLRNPANNILLQWRHRLDAVAAQIKTHGVRVINVSRQSALREYPKMDLAEALA